MDYFYSVYKFLLMKKTILSLVLILGSLTGYSQSQSQFDEGQALEAKSYALLDLGFEAKLLHLNRTPHTKPVIKSEVKKSPRSLEDILGVTKKVNQVKFHLIAGCFSSISNAKGLVSQLNQEGYDSKVIGQNEHGLHMVTYRTFDTESRALKVLNELETQGKASWIRKQ
jgi:cell division protein FtsN